MATSKRFAGVELGGTSWLLAIAVDTPTNIVEQTRIDTTTPKETLDASIAWLKTQSFDAIGIASFGPIDMNRSSPTYGYITNTPKPDWGNTEIVGVFQRAFPDTPIGFETDVNAPALYEVTHGGHGDISSACYITVGTGVGVGIALGGKAVHGYMHPEGGHLFVPPAPADRAAGFEGVCPFHGACVEGMVASRSIAARTGLDRRDVHTITDEDPVWDTIAHYLAYLCMNLTLTVSPEVIVIGGGISKREKLFVLIREKFETFMNHYVEYPAVDLYIRPSFHPDIGLVSSVELARLTLLEQKK
jgi:fructokinase